MGFNTNILKCAYLAGTCLCGAALAADGDLDAGFGSNGIAIHAVDLVAGGSDAVTDLVVADDGSVYQIGLANDGQYLKPRPVIHKLDASGNADYSFGSFGRVVLPNATTHTSAYGTMMGNGNVLIATTEEDVNGQAMAVLRQYRSNGVLDQQAFGGSGKAVLNSFPNADFVELADVALDGQGRIIVAGNTISRLPGGRLQMVVARLLLSGALDAGFGVRQGTPDVRYISMLRTIRVLPNDDIIAGGIARTSYGDMDLAFWKLRNTGATDTTFGNVGYRTVWFDIGGYNDDHIEDLEIRADGSIFAVGHAADSTGRMSVAATVLSASGQVDTSFGNQNPRNGRFLLTLGSGQDAQASGVATRVNGDLIVSLALGSATTMDFGALQFTSQGYLDTSFGFLGLRHYPFNYGTDYEYPTSIAVDAQDRVLIGGTAGYSAGDNDLMVMRLIR